MDRWKSRGRKSQRREEQKREDQRRSEKRKSQKKEDAGARKGRKVAKHSVFPMICGSGWSKSRLTKAASAEPSGQMRDENCTQLWREAHVEVKMYKAPFSDHFRKLRCRKSARLRGAKHISKSKCTKHLMFGRLLEVEMSKKCTPLWREAQLEVKMYKTQQLRNTFGRSDAVSRGRRRGLCTLSK